MNFIAPIVEGHGELDAVPILLRRIASEQAGFSVQINPPYRVSASAFLKFDREFQKAIQISAGKALDNGGFVLILLDCEDDCPAELGPRILAKARDERSDASFLVNLAYREFETWFLFGAGSLSKAHGLRDDLKPPVNPESLRDAKGWLSERMETGYKETIHQASFASKMSLDEALQSRSFRRLNDRIVNRLRET